MLMKKNDTWALLTVSQKLFYGKYDYAGNIRLVFR